MQGISSKVAGELENKKNKFQGQEYTDDLGLDMYEFKYRMDDPQTGRFWSIDPLADKYVYNSTYAFSEDKVTSHVELEGLESEWFGFVLNRAKREIVAKDGDEAGHEFDAGVQEGGKTTALLLFCYFAPGPASLYMLSSLTGVPVNGSPQMMAESTVASTTEATSTDAAAASSAASAPEAAPNLQQRATELNDLHPTTIARNMTTTAVGTGTSQAGEEVTMVATSRSNVAPQLRAALKPNEIPVSNKTLGVRSDIEIHAEQKLMQYMKVNNITPGSIGASKPICPSCATVMSNGGSPLASPLKMVSDGTYVKPPTIFPPR